MYSDSDCESLYSEGVEKKSSAKKKGKLGGGGGAKKTISKRSWTQDEDEALSRLVEEHGTSNWSIIGESMDGRTGKQCRERYHNHLQVGITKGNWTDKEDRIIVEMQQKWGNQWAMITKMLPGRTDNAVKNRWHAANRHAAAQVAALQAQASTSPSTSTSTASSTANKPVPTTLHQNQSGASRRHPLVPMLALSFASASSTSTSNPSSTFSTTSSSSSSSSARGGKNISLSAFASLSSAMMDLKLHEHDHSHDHVPYSNRSSAPSSSRSDVEMLGMGGIAKPSARDTMNDSPRLDLLAYHPMDDEWVNEALAAPSSSRRGGGGGGVTSESGFSMCMDMCMLSSPRDPIMHQLQHAAPPAPHHHHHQQQQFAAALVGGGNGYTGDVGSGGSIVSQPNSLSDDDAMFDLDSAREGGDSFSCFDVTSPRIDDDEDGTCAAIALAFGCQEYGSGGGGSTSGGGAGATSFEHCGPSKETFTLQRLSHTTPRSPICPQHVKKSRQFSPRGW